MPSRPGPAAGTIIARNYLPAARVLAESYRRHHPDAEFVVLVVDADDGEPATNVPWARLIGSSELDLDPGEFARMAIAYSVMELCTAVKPWLLRRLLADHPAAIYLDPDIEVFAPFGDEVGELAARHDIVLTPHVLEPMPRDGLRPSEADIMASGVFNLGFIAVSGNARPFLDFWCERLRQDAISAIGEQLFTDQRWVDNVPALFRHTVIRDPGFNVAFWNVYQRPLDRRPDGVLTAAGVPVRFVHYSGYRPDRPWLASTHYADRPRVLLSEWPLLAELVTAYRDKLIDAGHERDGVSYRWNALPDGRPVTPSLRRAFRRAWIDAERAGRPLPPSPFGPGDPAEFLRWATTPADPEQERAGLNPWAMALWHDRADLQRAYPDPLGAHAAKFRAWCATIGVATGELYAGAVRSASTDRRVPVRDVIGVNVLGYLTAELGVGEMGRLVHGAVVASGLPVATTVEQFTVANRTAHPLPEHAMPTDPRFGVSVLCVNADMTRRTQQLYPELADNRYVIGVWSWELAEFPPEMQAAFELVDEVWTISDFCAAAIGEHAPVPVHTFPVPVRDPLAGADGVGEPARRGRDGQTRFLFVFDNNSVFERKNPTGAIAAFERAFAGRDDVRLVIKSINGERHPGDRERLRAAAAAAGGRVELIEDYLSADEVAKLFASTDCYVSLHRSEGFGLTIAEAMAHGLPVIATDYSGSAELLTAETGWPVPHRLVPVGPGSPPYPPGARWAEPDLDAAAAAMREVADDPERAWRRGAAARRHVLASRSERAAAEWVRARIEDAHHRWRRDGGRRALRTAPVAAIRSAREALRWRADADAPSRLPMAPTLRRAVLRAVDHYDHHQRTVLGALMDGVEEGVGQLAELQGRTEDRLDRFEQWFAAIREDLAELAARVEQPEREEP